MEYMNEFRGTFHGACEFMEFATEAELDEIKWKARMINEWAIAQVAMNRAKSGATSVSACLKRCPLREQDNNK